MLYYINIVLIYLSFLHILSEAYVSNTSGSQACINNAIEQLCSLNGFEHKQISAFSIYLDGKLVNSFILAGFYLPVPDTSLYIGNNKDQYFNGFITRARFDNGGVNPQQAYSIYREGINTSFAGNFLDRYRIKVGLYEYTDRIGGFQI